MPNPPLSYELAKAAVDTVNQAIKDGFKISGSPSALTEAAHRLGISAGGLYARVKAAERLHGLHPGLTPQSTTDRLSEDLRKLKAENLLLKRELSNVKRDNGSAEEIRHRIFELSERSPEPPEWTLRDGRAGERGIPCTMWSDWHWGERIRPEEVGGVNEFTRATAEQRARRLVETTIDLAYNHMGRAKQEYPGIVICLGGDMMTGDIHDDLRETNWATPQQSINELTDTLAASIEAMVTRFGRCFIPCVVGNHGRGTNKPRAKGRVFTSHEWVIYCNLERHFRKTEHVKFLVSSETDAYFKIYGHRYLLTHGDSLGVKGGDGIIGSLGPIVRGALKVGRSEAQIGRDFDTLVMGHWHQQMTPPGVIVNGAFCGYNEYARIVLRARYERPSQALWFTHPEHGITATWPIYLEDQKSEKTKNWVEWKE